MYGEIRNFQGVFILFLSLQYAVKRDIFARRNFLPSGLSKQIRSVLKLHLVSLTDVAKPYWAFSFHLEILLMRNNQISENTTVDSKCSM